METGEGRGLYRGTAFNNPQCVNEVLSDLLHALTSLLPPGGPAARQDQTQPAGVELSWSYLAKTPLFLLLLHC